MYIAEKEIYTCGAAAHQNVFYNLSKMPEVDRPEKTKSFFTYDV